MNYIPNIYEQEKRKRKLKSHNSAAEAYKETTKKNIIAAKVTTYLFDSKHSEEFYSYRSKSEQPTDLFEDFPLALGSNQSVEEIDQFD